MARSPGRKSGEARTAAMMQQSTIPRNATISSGGVKPRSWESEIIDFDRNGPGVLGFYLDSVALMASLCPLYPEVRDENGEWHRSDDPVLKYALARFKGGIPEQSQNELVYRAVRSREALGRCWYINDPELGWTVVTKATAKDGWLSWTTMYGTPRRTPSDRAYQSWEPDDYEPQHPKSPVRRALDELKILRAINRNVAHSLNSRLVTNGILAFEREGTDPHPMMEPGKPQPDDPIVESYMEMAKLAHRDGDSPAASVPFAFSGKAPTWVEIGGNVDSGTMDVQEKAIEGFARAVNFPQQLLTEGPGAANHWNEYLLQETQVKTGLSPKLIPVCTDIYNCFYRPVLMKLRDSHSAFTLNPDNVRINYDLDFLLRRPSRLGELMEAYRLGIVTREAIVEELGENPLDIPEGLSEYEHWELATGNKGAPYVEVDAKTNELIIPPPPPGMPGGGGPDDPLAAGDPMAGAEPMGELMGGEPPLPPLGAPPDGGGGGIIDPEDPQPEPPGAIPVGAPALPPLTPNMGEVNDPEEPEMPKNVAAAAVIDASAYVRNQFQSNEVFADAAERDKELYARLLALVEKAAEEAALNVAKALIVAHPRGSEKRKELNSLEPLEVMRAADPQHAQGVDVAQIIEETLEPYQAQAQALIEDSEQSFIEKWGPLLAVVAAAGLASVAAGFFRDRIKHTLEPRFLIFIHDKPPAKLPATAMIARQTLAVAGGAAITSDGKLATDVNGNIIPTNGGVWTANLGHLTGQNWMDAYSGPNGPVEWIWVHGWLGDPEHPFPPHEALHMQSFKNPSEVPFGLHIDDHLGCRCGWLVVWD